MKRTFSLFVLTLLVHVAQAQNSGYHIPISIKQYKNQYIYLGYHYGNQKALADSALINSNGEGVFKGANSLLGGIYFIVSPKKEILFEVLLDKKQQFSIKVDSSLATGKVTFTGSEDNKIFQDYSAAIAISGNEINRLTAQLKAASSKADSSALITAIQDHNKKIQQIRIDIEKQHPESLLAALFRSMKEPAIPTPPAGNTDSAYAYKYFKAHYWDGISFTDERLLRTPIFEGKLDKYFKDLVVPDADSIKKEVDLMLHKSVSNEEMYKYLLIHFIQKYINPEYMGQDAVFVHIFEKYINDRPEVNWFTEKYKKYVYDRAYSLMANLIGQPAANLEMVDTLDRPTPLYNVNAPYTVVFFWDATCSHCKEIAPRLDSMFQHKWKALGIKVYGVMTDGGKEAWMNYLHEHEMKDWIHVYQTTAQKEADYEAGRPSYKQLYDVYQTPVIFLLDKEKRIIAKKITYQQVDEILSIKMKQ